MTAPPLRLVQTTGHHHVPPDPIERYEIRLRAKLKSERSITEAIQTLQRVQRHADYPIANLTTLQILRYLGQPHFSAATKHTYHLTLARFYEWLAREDDVPNPMDGLETPRRPRSVPRPINKDQLKALLALPLRRKTRAMVLLGALAGLRAHEIAKIRGEDFDLTARTIFVEGKGGHRAYVPMHAEIAKLAATMPRQGYWFPSPYKHRMGQPVRREFVGDVVGDAMRKVGIGWGAAHRLRHTFGTELVGHDVDLRTVQTLMRHADLTSTAIYTAVADGRRVEAIDRLTLD